MQQKMDALTNMLHELSSKMYQDTASKGEQQPPPGSEGHQKKEEKKEKAVTMASSTRIMK